jgi:putative peptidoglycan lipid II flippase
MHLKGFAKHTAVFGSLTTLSRLTGLLRMVALAAILGSGRGAAGRLNDAYQLANTIPNILYEFIMGGVLSALFIPVLVRAQEKSGKTSAESWRVANLLLGGAGLILAGVSALGVLFAPQIVGAMTFLARDAQAQESKETATVFFRFFAPQMLFYGLNAVFMAILNSFEVFAITAAAPIFNNLVMLVTLALYHLGWIGMEGLGVGTTLGVAAMALVQVPWLVKVGMPFRPRVDFRDPVLRSVGALSVPVVAVSAANLVGTAVRANLLYTVPGGFTAYTFCFTLIMMPYGIFAVAIATVLYPALSRHASGSDRASFAATMATGVRWTSLVMLPVAAGLSLLAEPITRVLFQRGQFTYSDTLFTSRFLAFYALSIFPYALVIYATRVFYSMQDTRTPAWINIAGVALNVVLNIILLRPMGAPGIALASAVTYSVTAIVSFVVLRVRLGETHCGKVGGALGRIAAATGVMALAIWLANGHTQPALSVVASGQRAALRLPEWAVVGHALLVNNDADYASLRREWGAGMSVAPDLDFRRESFLAFFGPQSPTTVTLQLRKLARADDGSASFTLAVHRSPKPPESRVFHLPARPAYLMAVVRPPIAAAHPEFLITDAPPASRWTRILQAPEALRLLLLTALGAVVFVGACAALGLEDLKSLARAVARRKPQDHYTAAHKP